MVIYVVTYNMLTSLGFIFFCQLIRRSNKHYFVTEFKRRTNHRKSLNVIPLFVAMFPFGVVNRQLGSFALGYRFPRTRTTCGSTRSRPPVAIVEGENNPSLTLIQSKEGRYMLFTKEESEEPVKHFLVANTGYSLRVCQYCKLKGDKFANGNTRQTYYKCDACGVHLCRPQIRDCFVNYHQLKFANDS